MDKSSQWSAKLGEPFLSFAIETDDGVRMLTVEEVDWFTRQCGYDRSQWRVDWKGVPLATFAGGLWKHHALVEAAEKRKQAPPLPPMPPPEPLHLRVPLVEGVSGELQLMAALEFVVEHFRGLDAGKPNGMPARLLEEPTARGSDR